MASFFDATAKTTPFKRPDSAPLMHNEHQMRKLIDGARQHAAQGGKPIALLEVGLKRRSRLQQRRTPEQIAQVLPFLGKTDAIGWINGRPAILIQGLDQERAKQLASTLKRDALSQSETPCFLYAYPALSNTPDRDAGSASNEPETVSQWNIRIACARQGGGDCSSGPEQDTNIRVHPLSDVLRRPLPAWKRFLDIAGASAMLFGLAPLLGATILFLQLRDPGPILFRQRRFGHLGIPFEMLKLRTMRIRSDERCHQAHLRELIKSNARLTKLDSAGDPRIIPGATLLRKLGIDELPQLINVLRGEMSLVGPRPCLDYEVEAFERRHFARFNVRPGLTGLWQVSGKNRTTFREMLALDVHYSECLRLSDDLLILIRTIPAVLADAFYRSSPKTSGQPNREDTRTESSASSQFQQSEAQ